MLVVIEFEKWRAISISVGGVGGVLAWMVCLCGWRGWCACVGGVFAVIEFEKWRAVRVSVGAVGGVAGSPAWVA